MGDEVTEISIILAVGGLVNVLLVLCLAHSWAFWRQVKWYVIMLAAANWMELIFRFSVNLGWNMTWTWEGTSASCKFLMMTRVLGMNLATSSLAALSVHVLLTFVTGCQGDRARHSAVIGVFVLLSLPVPIAQAVVFNTMPIPGGHDGAVQCVTFQFLQTSLQQQMYTTGSIVSMVFFPLFVFLCCSLASAVLACSASGGNIKGDESTSDLVLCCLQGLLVIVCCVPYYVAHIISISPKLDNANLSSLMNTKDDLKNLENTRVIWSAVVAVIFAYVHAFRNRGEGYIPPETDRFTGERTKLVN